MIGTLAGLVGGFLALLAVRLAGAGADSNSEESPNERNKIGGIHVSHRRDRGDRMPNAQPRERLKP